MWFALGTFFIVLGIGLALRMVCHSIEVAAERVSKQIHQDNLWMMDQERKYTDDVVLYLKGIQGVLVVLMDKKNRAE